MFLPTNQVKMHHNVGTDDYRVFPNIKNKPSNIVINKL